MNRSKLFASLLVIPAAWSFLQLPGQAAKKWTVTQRQEQLAKETGTGEKANELTKKEADDVRSDLADISSRIAKMKEKNGGKLSYKDEGKIEKALNDVSLKIQKLKLQKRVTAH